VAADTGRGGPRRAQHAVKRRPESTSLHQIPDSTAGRAPAAGQPTPLPVMLSLVPIMVGVAAASAAELSFNWMGFLTAMMSNLTLGAPPLAGLRAPVPACMAW
jgi:hypothetical protein